MQQVDWLADAERKAYAEWKLCALLETCEAKIRYIHIGVV